MKNGFVDLQVNGYASVDFNSDDLTDDALHRACQKLAEHGVETVLVNLVTDDVYLMCKRLSRLAQLMERDPRVRQVVAGFHVEGPFLNEATGYRGAHPHDFIRPADPDVVRQLLDAGRGLVRLVTLAPERDPGLKVTRLLVEQKILVAAGHTDATLDQLRAATDAGVTLFTHLGNGCPMQIHRHDNIIQRALSLRDRLWLCFIADGVHIPFFALGNYLRSAGFDRCVVVTDAMAAAGLGPGQYWLGRWKVTVGNDLAAWAPDRSHLMGSAMTMPQNFTNLTQHLSLTPEQARQLTQLNPRRALGM